MGRTLQDWNPKFDKFFEAHEQTKKAGAKLQEYKLN